MKNNDILRSLRYTFNLSDSKMVEVFSLGNQEVTKEEINNWLKKDEDPTFIELYDKSLSAFLNGLIIYKRGKKEGEEPKPEKSLNNNLILRKLKIALSFKDEDIIAILQLRGFKVSKHELSALFRSPDQPQYRICHDQFLRNFLYGLQLKYRPSV